MMMLYPPPGRRPPVLRPVRGTGRADEPTTAPADPIRRPRPALHHGRGSPPAPRLDTAPASGRRPARWRGAP